MCVFTDETFANVLTKTERRHVLNELYKALRGNWKSQTHYMMELPNWKVLGIGRVDGINGGTYRSTFLARACFSTDELLINRTIAFYLDGEQYGKFFQELAEDEAFLVEWRSLLQSKIECVYVTQDGLLRRNTKVKAKLIDALDRLLVEHVHVKVTEQHIHYYKLIDMALSNPDGLNSYFVDAFGFTEGESEAKLSDTLEVHELTLDSLKDSELSVTQALGVVSTDTNKRLQDALDQVPTFVSSGDVDKD